MYFYFPGVDKYEPNLYPDKEFQMQWLKEYLENWFLVNGCTTDVTQDDVEILYIQVNKFALVILKILFCFCKSI